MSLGRLDRSSAGDEGIILVRFVDDPDGVV